ncbi:ribbon-helix-helix domain-containing protein [Clostridium botulinum]|uniref:ribbon-helix-helix domain-containing protein n=1 Tax=unclassified Clostridium TaxID=2614128 RepID=UPI000A1724AC|nr:MULTISPECIES: ribbon-helix-helix domain-containing protein [unclassified Clostridium]MBY7009575.1 ribbon-helix-helix domain-containing protein [Clostridium botulinum]NFH74496.1 ribbon-helix-helix domain-containing protein [Clostridium botulinum]NFI82466.1 ribbon-helix-helix domain-containing protein [Clostridium botulinum]NFJ74003.1 ribbon-helix-helix domain-containing protein [Clostridium botulinum]NFK66574.1 ribbon-helix-helix domain-containing protein [Clostridium botulinum]
MANNSNNDLKNRQRYTSSFDTELLKKLKDLSKETMIPLSKLLDKGIELLLKEYNKK